MGILKNIEGDVHENEPVNSIPPIDLINNPDHFNEASTSSEDEDNPTNESATTPATVQSAPVRRAKVKKMVSKMPKPILHIKSLGGKKSQGNRQARRHENMCFLLNLARDLDEDFAEVNINDLVETTISAFAELLLNKSKMKIWNEFIELPEKQQERFIKMAKNKKKNKKKISVEKPTTTTTNENAEKDVDSFVLIENLANTTDRKEPIYQPKDADVCFRHIDPNIRYTLKGLLKRHQLPLERISWFEDDIIPYFTEHPDSIYLRHLNHGFDRLLLHAVCQYLNLPSKSSTRDGERYTQVENRCAPFHPPKILLSDYLKHLDKLSSTD